MRKRGLWIVALIAVAAASACSDGNLVPSDGPKKLDVPKLDVPVPDGQPYPMGLAPGAAPVERLALLEAAGASEVSLVFRWEDLPGRPAEVDLNVGPADEPLFQVFASDGQPFARAGLRLVPLAPRADYRLRLASTAGGVRVALTHLPSGEVTELGELATSADWITLPLSMGTTDGGKTRVQVAGRVVKGPALAWLF